MKSVTKLALVLLSTMTFSMVADAHDPKQHVKQAEKADCSKLDQSKLDTNDPVAMAMMKKCKKQTDAAQEEMDHSNMNHKDMKNDDKPDDAKSEHDHQ